MVVSHSADGTEADNKRDGYISDIPSTYSPVPIIKISVNQESLENSDDEQYCERRSRSRTLDSERQVGRARSCSRSRAISEVTPTSIFSMTRQQKWVLLVTSLAEYVAFLSVSVMAPFFPEQALEKGISNTLSGWIFGMAPFVQFLVAPVFGKLMPMIGVKFMLVSGVFFYSGCTILFGFLDYVPTDEGIELYIGLAFLIQVCKSVGIAACSTSSFVLDAQMFPDNIATVLGITEVFVGLGLVSGPAIGGVLFGLDGFYLPFLCIGAVGMALVPFLIWLVPQEKPLQTSSKERIPLTRVFCSPFGVLTCCTIITSTFMWSILDPTLEPFLRKFDLSPEMVGVIFLIMAAVYALSSPIWGFLSDKLDEQRGLLIMGFLFAALGSLLIGPSPLLGLGSEYSELWLVVLALVILGASASLSSVPTFDIFFTLAEEKGCEDDTETYSTVAGVWMAMYSLGDFIGPSAGGILSDSIGFTSMCTYTAGLCLIMALLLILSWIHDSTCCSRASKALEENVIQSGQSLFRNTECFETSENSPLLG